MSALSASQLTLLEQAKNLEAAHHRMGSPTHGLLVSGVQYRTALALEKMGLGAVRYQGPSMGWFTATLTERFVSAYRTDGKPETIQGIFTSFLAADRSARRTFTVLSNHIPRPEKISTEARTERWIDDKWVEV